MSCDPITWDWKEQPPWDKINDELRPFSVRIDAVDTGTDQYGCKVTSDYASENRGGLLGRGAMSDKIESGVTCSNCGAEIHGRLPEKEGDPIWCDDCDWAEPESVELLRLNDDLLNDEAYQQRIYDEAMAERDVYIKRGVCSQCGAKSQWEAQAICTATQDITGEYTCAGDDLWRDKESNETNK